MGTVGGGGGDAARRGPRARQSRQSCAHRAALFLSGPRGTASPDSPHAGPALTFAEVCGAGRRVIPTAARSPRAPAGLSSAGRAVGPRETKEPPPRPPRRVPSTPRARPAPRSLPRGRAPPARGPSTARPGPEPGPRVRCRPAPGPHSPLQHQDDGEPLGNLAESGAMQTLELRCGHSMATRTAAGTAEAVGRRDFGGSVWGRS